MCVHLVGKFGAFSTGMHGTENFKVAVQSLTSKGNTGHGPGVCKSVTDSIFILYSRAEKTEKQFWLKVEI